jgi:uncharacterized cupredoxin-like copper-binding protein
MRVRLRRFGALAALLMFVATGAVAAAGPPEGSVGIRLLDAPVDRAADPRARVYIVDHLAPGTTISRRVAVNNATDAEQAIQLYPGAFRLDDGEVTALPRGRVNDIVRWTTVDPQQVTLAPGQSAEATVTIAVPPDASPGERYGVVWAELPPTTSDGVTAVNRVGVRTYLSVGEGGEPASDFTIGRLRGGPAPDGFQQVTAEITNTGGRAIDVTGELTLSERVTTVGPFQPETLTLAPGERGTLVVPIRPRTTRGRWNAELVATTGTVEHTATGRVRLPAARRKTPPASNPGSTTPDLPF